MHSLYCVSQLGSSFCHLRPNLTTMSYDSGDSHAPCPKNSEPSERRGSVGEKSWGQREKGKEG